ncbi:hypothetical protein [Sphingomonas sp. LaA6.9]|uniref:hypothetical protein n=1 Tax=Sphingomonas sp. LaA6.9 TaxID=2919914 RepID=UPI001F4FCA5E|nr:hypothetical protein [Sphingomonas sp. LaA6.9]MCJ8158843.1 hypothetical protein [Sphingomonas sp. LaA6.9]
MSAALAASTCLPIGAAPAASRSRSGRGAVRRCSASSSRIERSSIDVFRSSYFFVLPAPVPADINQDGRAMLFAALGLGGMFPRSNWERGWERGLGTSNPLKSRHYRQMFPCSQRPRAHAISRMRTRARISDYHHFLGTLGTFDYIIDIQCVGRSQSRSQSRSHTQALGTSARLACLKPQISAISNKIVGGYALSASTGADLRSFEAAALEKLSAWCASAAPIGALELLDQGEAGERGLTGENGGFLRLSGGAQHAVRMAASECEAQRLGNASISGAGRKLLRLRAVDLGAIAASKGGRPPFAGAEIRCPLAQPIFWISVELRSPPRPACHAVAGDGREMVADAMGHGARVATPGEGSARETRRPSDLGLGARDLGSPSISNVELTTLWAGSRHVNG